MKTKHHDPKIQEMLASLGANAIDLVQKKGAEMEAEIAKKMAELERTVWAGYSSNGSIKVQIDGQFHIIEINVEPGFEQLMKDQAKACALIAEAVNDAIYTADLGINSEMSNIQYRFSGDIIEQAYKPAKINDMYKKVISDVKHK